MTDSEEDVYANDTDVFESLIDDIWIDISILLNIQDFISFRLCCNQFNKVTYPSQNRINKYWKFACIKLLGALGDGLIHQKKQWYPIFIELYKYVNIYVYQSSIKSIIFPLRKYPVGIFIPIKRKEWQNAILCQPSEISVVDNVNMKFLGSRSMMQLEEKNMPRSEYEWNKIRMFWKHMILVLRNDLLSVFKILIDCQPFINDINTKIYDSRYYHNIPFEQLKNWFDKFESGYQRPCVTIFSLICASFASLHCVKIFEYLLSLRCDDTKLLYEGTKPLFWTLVCSVCNGLYQHSPFHEEYSRIRMSTYYRKKHSDWLQIDHFGMGYRCIENIFKKHLDLELNPYTTNYNENEHENKNQIVTNESVNTNTSLSDCVDHTKLDINFKSHSNLYIYSSATSAGSVLDIAINCSRPHIARLLMKYGASIDDIVKNMNIKEKLIELLSINVNTGEMIKFWIDYFKIDINKYKVNDNGDTILVYAISNLDKKKFDDQQIGFIDTIYSLLENSPTIDIINQNYDCKGRSVFLQAIDKHCQWTVSNIYNHLVSRMKARVQINNRLKSNGNTINIVDDDQCSGYNYNYSYNNVNTMIKHYINYYRTCTQSQDVDIDHDEKKDDSNTNSNDEKENETFATTVGMCDSSDNSCSINTDKSKPDAKKYEGCNAESIYLYVCKQLPSKDEFMEQSQNHLYFIYLEEFMKKLPPLIKVLIDVKVDITVKDEKDDKMGSDYICNIYDIDNTLATFKHFVQTQESIAVYFNSLNYSIVHVAENGITPTYAQVLSPIATDDHYNINENEDIGNNLNAIVTPADSKAVQLVNSVTTLSLDDNHDI